MWMNVLYFFLGGSVGVLGLVVVAFVIGTREKLREAEALKKKLKEEQARYQEQVQEQMDKAAQLINEFIRKKQQPQTTKQPTSQVTSTDPNVEVSVKDRLRKAVEITSKQMKIDTRQGPDFQLEHNELELEKLNVLRTILADGFDPVITIRYNTGDQEMLLSSYVDSITKGLM